MTLAEILAERGIDRALVVDDACDEVPLAGDLSGRQDEWSIFFADLEPEHRDLIAVASPETADLASGQKIANDRYVAAVWGLRDQLGATAEALFEAYEHQRAADLEYVDLARARLEALGVAVTTCGREFEGKAADVPLILIDLYFGGAQNEEAFTESRRRLTDVVNARRDNPPLVLLMSRSERLYERRDEFRDEVGLVDSGFRILIKPELRNDAKLERQIERLAVNLPDTLKLARFFLALESGIASAAQRTLIVMRRLKLSDVTQIQQLLLEFEGEPIGSYLVDIFDRVLQHEIEREEAIIQAARTVSELASSEYPPPFVAGSPYLQELVERTLTQNMTRLQLSGSDSSVTFGDVLKPIATDDKLPLGLKPDQVLVVMTPVCDLQREAAPRVLLMVGQSQPLDKSKWSYGPDARTPAILLDGELRWIKWDVKHVVTLAWSELDEMLESSSLLISARLREAHALEIQQKMLSGLGRVGLLAPMPATFTVAIETYVLNSDGQPRHLESEQLRDDGIVWVGRDKARKPVLRLVATERFCDGLADAIGEIDPETLAAGARQAFLHLVKTGDLSRLLGRGLDVTTIKTDAWLPTAVITENAQCPHVALIALKAAPPPIGKSISKAGVMLVLREHDQELGAPSLKDFVRPSLDAEEEIQAQA